MPTRFPRLTIRRLMLAVAIVAALFWSVILVGRSVEYRRLATRREMTCRLLRAEIDSLTGDVEAAKAAGAPTAMLETDISVRREALVEEERAATLYRERTWRPWKTVRYR